MAFGSPRKSKLAPASWVLRSKYCSRLTLAPGRIDAQRGDAEEQVDDPDAEIFLAAAGEGIRMVVHQAALVIKNDRAS
jgi:hypothetical protein